MLHRTGKSNIEVQSISCSGIVIKSLLVSSSGRIILDDIDVTDHADLSEANKHNNIPGIVIKRSRMTFSSDPNKPIIGLAIASTSNVKIYANGYDITRPIIDLLNKPTSEEQPENQGAKL